MFEIMLYPFLALIGISLISGAYGCQMIWHKVACLGDTLSHGALLGLALGVLVGINENIALFLLSAVWAFFLWVLTKSKQNSLDTIMAFLMQASIALAILLFSVAGDANSSLMHAFLGDVLMINVNDLIVIGILDIVLGVVLLFCWKKWILIAISPDLAKARRMHTSWLQFVFFLSIGFFVAMTLQLMGALLAPAFFVIPALTARQIARSPEKMALLATVIAMLSCAFGLMASFHFDLPTGATVVVTALGFYILLSFYTSIKNMLIKKPL